MSYETKSYLVELCVGVGERVGVRELEVVTEGGAMVADGDGRTAATICV